MAIEKVREYLEKFGYEDKIMEFDDTSATVYEASLRLNCTEDEIAKTLSFLVEENPIVIVMSGKARVDNHKFKETFNVKAKMIERDKVNELIGHEPGGVCPFAINSNVKVYLDVSLKKHEYVYPACGSDNSAIKLTIKELETLSNFIEWVDVAKENME